MIILNLRIIVQAIILSISSEKHSVHKWHLTSGDVDILLLDGTVVSGAI